MPCHFIIIFTMDWRAPRWQAHFASTSCFRYFIYTFITSPRAPLVSHAAKALRHACRLPARAFAFCRTEPMKSPMRHFTSCRHVSCHKMLLSMRADDVHARPYFFLLFPRRDTAGYYCCVPAQRVMAKQCRMRMMTRHQPSITTARIIGRH